MSGHYTEALKWIKANCGPAGKGINLAKMVLSLYNMDCEFSFRECVDGLDNERRKLCVQMCDDYSLYGETPELLEVGRVVAHELYPYLWIECQAMRKARGEWQSARETKWREEQEENHADDRIIEEHDRLRGTYNS